MRRGRWVVIAVVLISLPAAYRAGRLYANLRSDLDALLPRDAPSVSAIEELRRRMATRSWLGVVVEAKDAAGAEGARRLLADLAARVRAYPPSLEVRRVSEGAMEERAFFELHAPLYLPRADLAKLRDRVIERRSYELSRRLDLLIDDAEPPPSLGLDELAARFEAGAGLGVKLPPDRFVSADGRGAVLLIEVGRMESGTSLGGALLRRVRADLAEMGGTAAYAKDLRLGFAGDVAARVEELDALVVDLSVASIAVLLLVTAVIYLYYRFWQAIVVLGVPLLAGTALAFGIAALPPLSLRELNANTAFLGSIIVGNGVNTGIILLARYVEERRRGAAQEPAMITALATTWRATGAAALAAAVAYGSLVFTRFRGFNQFGWVGALGMALCWVLTMLLVPPLVGLFDRNGCMARPLRAPGLPGVSWLLARVARLVGTRSRAILVFAAVPTLAGMAALAGVNEGWIETDYSKLRRADSSISGEAYWGARMNQILGRYLTPMVILTSDLDETRRVAAGVREASSGELRGSVARVITIDDLLPPDLEARTAIAREIAALAGPRVLAGLAPEKRARFERMLSHAALCVLTAAEVPESVTLGLRDREGRLDRAVLVFPDPAAGLWRASTLRQLSESLRSIAARAAAPGAKGAAVAGAPVLSYDILEALRRDGPEITAIAFVLVLFVILAAFRGGPASILVAGSLVVSAVWLAGVLRLSHVKLNFANFVAFPVTFGIGADYGINVIGRWIADGKRSAESAVASTGGAVVLASVTTVIGYTSLLFAANRALYLFGLAAVLGEVAALVTSIVVLPAALTAFGGGAGSRGAAKKNGACTSDGR